MEGLTAAFSGAFDAAQQWLFEAVIGPAAFALGAGHLLEDGYAAAGWVVAGLLQIAVMLLLIGPAQCLWPAEPVTDRAAIRVDVLYTLLHRLGVAEERLRLVINGTKRGHGVNLDDVPDYLHLSPVAAIPWDDETFDAMDLHGRLAWEVAKRGALARALEGLWDAVAGEGEEILLRMRRTA